MPWLISILIRLASGESFRKATPTELRWWSAGFAFFPVFTVLIGRLGNAYLNNASGVVIWLFLMGTLLTAALWLALWTRFVPARFSWVLSAVVWGVAVWLGLTDKFVDLIGPRGN